MNRNSKTQFLQNRRRASYLILLKLKDLYIINQKLNFHCHLTLTTWHEIIKTCNNLD